MDIKKISVVIIVKNAQNTILKCLNSIKDFGEIILLDNKSTDDTLKIAKKFQENHTNLKI
ncbi:glycosyltransferase, partial [Campylobacter volucris]